MGIEIERKFLVLDDSWRDAATGARYRQGYLSVHADATVRVRVVGVKGWLTIKGRTVGASRAEFEYEIPLNDAQLLLNNLCEKPLIDKTRYRCRHAGMDWEIDEFHGSNRGLVVAEVELRDEAQVVAMPPWIGDEVTADRRYANSSLVRTPFCSWDA